MPPWKRLLSNSASAERRLRLSFICRNELLPGAKRSRDFRPMNPTGYYGWPESAPRHQRLWETRKKQLGGSADPTAPWGIAHLLNS